MRNWFANCNLDVYVFYDFGLKYHTHTNTHTHKYTHIHKYKHRKTINELFGHKHKFINAFDRFCGIIFFVVGKFIDFFISLIGKFIEKGIKGKTYTRTK